MTSNFAPSLDGSTFRCRIRHMMSVREERSCRDAKIQRRSGVWLQVLEKKLGDTMISPDPLRAARAVNSRGLCLVAKADAQAHWRHEDLKFGTSVRLKRLTHESSRWVKNLLQHEHAPSICSPFRDCPEIDVSTKHHPLCGEAGAHSPRSPSASQVGSDLVQGGWG